MLPRIWIVLLALLLLAAPADRAFAEITDGPPPAGLCDDDVLDRVEVQSAERAPDRLVCSAWRGVVVLPTPVLARVFRPPRPSFG